MVEKKFSLITLNQKELLYMKKINNNMQSWVNIELLEKTQYKTKIRDRWDQIQKNTVMFLFV